MTVVVAVKVVKTVAADASAASFRHYFCYPTAIVQYPVPSLLAFLESESQELLVSSPS